MTHEALWHHFEHGIVLHVTSANADKQLLQTCADMGIRWAHGGLANEWSPAYTDSGWASYYVYFDDRTRRLYYSDTFEWGESVIDAIFAPDETPVLLFNY